MPQATLIYDGPCTLCTRWAKRVQAWAGSQNLRIMSWEEPGALDLHPDLSLQRCLQAVQLVYPDGRLFQGAQAAAFALALKPGFAWIPYFYSFLPIKLCADLLYQLVSRQRRRCENCGTF